MPYDLQPGDVVAFYGRDLMSRAISLATWGPSHVAIAFRAEDGRLLLGESTTLCPWPCEIKGLIKNGVQAHDPTQRIELYRGRVEVYRLAPECRLSSLDASLLAVMLECYWIGEPYDLGGAILSGTRLAKFFRFWPYPDRGSVFCSALVARLLMRLNRMNWADPEWFNPANLVRTLRRTGVYDPPVVLHV